MGESPRLFAGTSQTNAKAFVCKNKNNPEFLKLSSVIRRQAVNYAACAKLGWVNCNPELAFKRVKPPPAFTNKSLSVDAY